MEEKKVKILVIIPVYNTEQYLEKCLDSVISQKYQNWKAFVIDDGSSDNSFQIMKTYAEKDTRINVYQNTENQGPGRTRNAALELALTLNEQEDNSNEYIVFIDSDDWVDEEYFLSISKTASKRDADVIFVDLVQEDITGKVIKSEQMSLYKGKPKDTLIRHQMTGKMPWGGVRKAVKKDLLTHYNIKYSHDSIGEEAMYSFKLLYNAEKIEFIEEGLYHYVIHSNSQSGTYDDDPYNSICKKLRDYLKEINEYENYKPTLVSFAFTALVVGIYRKARYYSISKALRESKLSLKKYKRTFGFKLDMDSLETRVRLLLPFAKLNLVLPIVLIAKIKAYMVLKK